MPKQKLQHIVPRSYLQAFVDPACPIGQEPYLWKVEKKNGVVSQRAPKKTAVEPYYYSFKEPDGSRNHAVENWLADVESEATPVLRRLAANADPGRLSVGERRSMALYLALLEVRGPKFRDPVDQFTCDIMKTQLQLLAADEIAFRDRLASLERECGLKPPHSLAEVRQFIRSNEYTISVEPLNSLQHLVTLAPGIAELIEHLGWRVLHSRGTQRFVTSDAPVAKVQSRPIPAPHLLGTAWGTPWMEATVPLSPTACLLIGMQFIDGVETAEDATIQEINRRTTTCAHEAVFSSSRINVKRLNEDGFRWSPVSKALRIPPPRA